MIRSFENKTPIVGDKTHIDETAVVLGDVTLGQDCFILPMVTLRGDVNPIVIGDRTNIQEMSVVHTNHTGSPYVPASSMLIGDDVTIGHGVILHGCQIQSRCLVGMGSIIMDGVVIEENTIIGAGSLVPSNKVLTGGQLWLGRPAKPVRSLTPAQINSILYSAQHYVALKNKHAR